jgi:hypothetical protein
MLRLSEVDVTAMDATRFKNYRLSWAHAKTEAVSYIFDDIVLTT